jgi:hypothetical protein
MIEPMPAASVSVAAQSSNRGETSVRSETVSPARIATVSDAERLNVAISARPPIPVLWTRVNRFPRRSVRRAGVTHDKYPAIAPA